MGHFSQQHPRPVPPHCTALQDLRRASIKYCVREHRRDQRHDPPARGRRDRVLPAQEPLLSLVQPAGRQVVGMWQQESGLGPSGQVRVTPCMAIYWPFTQKGIQHGHFRVLGDAIIAVKVFLLKNLKPNNEPPCPSLRAPPLPCHPCPVAQTVPFESMRCV